MAYPAVVVLGDRILLDAVRSAVTAIAELLVIISQTSVLCKCLKFLRFDNVAVNFWQCTEAEINELLAKILSSRRILLPRHDFV